MRIAIAFLLFMFILSSNVLASDKWYRTSYLSIGAGGSLHSNFMNEKEVIPLLGTVVNTTYVYYPFKYVGIGIFGKLGMMNEYMNYTAKGYDDFTMLQAGTGVYTRYIFDSDIGINAGLGVSASWDIIEPSTSNTIITKNTGYSTYASYLDISVEKYFSDGVFLGLLARTQFMPFSSTRPEQLTSIIDDFQLYLAIGCIY